MAVTSARVITPPVAGVDAQFNRTYTVKLQVFSDKTEGPLSVLNAIGVPPWGSFYQYGSELDPWCFAQNYNAVVKEDVTYNPGDGGERFMWKWEVTVKYSSAPTGRGNTQSPQNPLNEPPIISGSFVMGTEPALQDIDEVRISDTSGLPYDPAPDRPTPKDTLQIAYNTSAISLPQRASAVGRVNSVAIWGLEVRQALMTRWDYQILYAGSLAYIRNSFEFEIDQQTPTPTDAGDICKGSSLANKKGYYTVLANEGLAPLNDGKNVRKRDEEDSPLPRPVRLKCDGTEETNTSLDKWNVFKIEEEYDFNTIPNMPNPLPGPFA